MTVDELMEYFREYDARAKHEGDGMWWYATCDSVCSVTEEELGTSLAPFFIVWWGGFEGLGCEDGHCWIEHPDGTIVDPTSRQFAGHEHMAVITPGDPRQAWYRRPQPRREACSSTS